MSTIKISQLPSATIPLSGSVEVPLVQSGVTKKAAISAFSSFVDAAAYGAVGNGTTDDTLALRAAFAAAHVGQRKIECKWRISKSEIYCSRAFFN